MKSDAGCSAIGFFRHGKAAKAQGKAGGGNPAASVVAPLTEAFGSTVEPGVPPGTAVTRWPCDGVYMSCDEAVRGQKERR